MNPIPAELLDQSFPLPLDAPFTTSQARAAGLRPHDLTRLVTTGHLRRLLKGVYAPAQCPDSREIRARAVSLFAPPGSVVCDWTATWLWTGIDHPAAHYSLPAPDVFRFRGQDRMRNGLTRSGQRWFLPSDVVPFVGDLLVTSPLRTAWDLGRFSRRIVAIGGMDALARTDAFTLDELVSGVERFRRQRGVVQLRHLAPMVNGRSESPGESALRMRWLEASALPPPECQISLTTEHGIELYRIDLGLRRLQFGAEYDGEEWHDSPHQMEHDRTRRHALRHEFGWHIEVFRRDDVFGQSETATERLLRGIEEARRTLPARLGGY